MFGLDTGEIWFDGIPGFVTEVNVLFGFGCEWGSNGSLTASGTLDLATGATTGEYTGELCTSGW